MSEEENKEIERTIPELPEREQNSHQPASPLRESDSGGKSGGESSGGQSAGDSSGSKKSED